MITKKRGQYTTYILSKKDIQDLVPLGERVVKFYSEEPGSLTIVCRVKKRKDKR